MKDDSNLSYLKKISIFREVFWNTFNTVSSELKGNIVRSLSSLVYKEKGVDISDKGEKLIL